MSGSAKTENRPGWSAGHAFNLQELPVSTTTFPTALSLYITHEGRKHKHNPTLPANKHVAQICRSSLSAAAKSLADGSGERRTSPVNGIERSLSCAVQYSQSLCPSPLPRFQQRCPCTSRTRGENKSTIQRSPRTSTSHKFVAPRYRLPPMALRKIAQLCRTVVPKSPPVSATGTTFPTALSFYITQGRLRKDIRYSSCSQGQNRCHSKGI